MPKSIETKTEIKLSIPIAQKISLGILMTGAFIALFALVYGLYNSDETFQKPYKEATGAICPDGRIATKCSCGRIIRTPSSNYCCNNVYQTTVCPELRLWLPFDDNLSDYSGNNNHAICTSPYCPAYAAGHTGKATEYSNTSNTQYLTVTNSEGPLALNIAGAVTIALWLNPEDITGIGNDGTWQRIIASPKSFTAPYVLSYIGSDKSLAISRSGSNPLARKAVGLEEGKWQHVAAGYDASNNPFIYINGVKQTLVDYLGTPPGIASGSFRIGMRQDNVAGFNGLIDELRIYSRVLSQAEINELAGIMCTPTAEICSDGIDQDCNGSDLICPACTPNAPITTRCLCGGLPYNSGYCCNNVQQPNACTAPVACEATAGHSCYYMAPAGNDTPPPNGGTLTNPWRTFGYADNYLHAGDYLYIKGGDYSMTYQNRFEADGDQAGTDTNHKATIKAYGDSPAYFTLTAGQEGVASIFLINSGADWFTVDGLFNGQRYLIFRTNVANRLISIGNENDPPEIVQPKHVSLIGIELDGSPAHARVNHSGPFLIHKSDYASVENSYIHDFWLPTWDPSCDPSCQVKDQNLCIDCSQEGPDCVVISQSDFSLIQNNIIENCNHGAIDTGPIPGDTYGVRYGKILNNTINVNWGGGIYIDDNVARGGGSEYNLVEGNIVVNPGGSTTYGKPGIAVASKNNTIRNNVIYAPSATGIEFTNSNYYAIGNLVYNNIVFSGGLNDGTWEAGVYFFALNIRDINENTIANNIVYKTGFPNIEVMFRPGDPPLPCLNLAGHFCGNKFFNNLIRDESASANPMNDNVVVTFNRLSKYSLDYLQLNESTYWKNNIANDPMLLSENPNDANWWHLQPGSPAIDKGRVIPDTNGEYVRNMCGSGNTFGCTPNNGWNNLPYNGIAPDIGAYESPVVQTQTTNVNSSNVNTNISVPVD